MTLRRRCIILLLAAVALGLCVGEAGLRLAGGLSFPLYVSDPYIGYYPAPNQSGSYFHRHRWGFNEASMGVAMPWRATPDAVLLVGDSIVFGGNPLDQPDKLGPRLAQVTGRPVYPLAAGGWALDNELRMLRAHPALLSTPTIVWVSETGDFGVAAKGDDPLNWPRHRPASALYHYLAKFIFHAGDVTRAPQSAEATRQWQADLDWLLAHYHGRLIWVLYPERTQMHKPLPPDFAPLLDRIRGRAERVDVFAAGQWREGLYRDGVIHPNVAGNIELARLIARQLNGPQAGGDQAAPMAARISLR